MSATIWAVRIEPKRGCETIRDRQTRKVIQRRVPDNIYVRASTPESAFATAKRNNPSTHYKVTGPARVATPQELGCVPVGLTGEDVQ